MLRDDETELRHRCLEMALRLIEARPAGGHDVLDLAEKFRAYVGDRKAPTGSVVVAPR